MVRITVAIVGALLVLFLPLYLLLDALGKVTRHIAAPLPLFVAVFGVILLFIAATRMKNE
jgi:hypothetical protein